MGRIVLDMSFFPLQFLLFLFKTGIVINGKPFKTANWGKNVIDVPPGYYSIQTYTDFLWQFGHTTATIPVNAGRQIDVYYRSPGTPWGPGAIGPMPQPTPNLTLMFVLSFAPVVVAIILVTVGLALS
jgi:hypothetical protein